jgi:uncharacterized protein (DUF2141 family)
MNHRLPMLTLVLVMCCGFMFDQPTHGAQGSSLPPKASPTGQVTVTIADLRDDRGQVLAALFQSAEGFPSDGARAFARKAAKIHDKRVEVVFEQVPEGPFAIGVHHDENANFKMETGAFGIPTEGYGVSRDAPAKLGPPKFKDAQLTLGAAEHKRIIVHVRY